MATRKEVGFMFLAVVILALLALAVPDKSVEMDAKEYCQRVHDRTWPDYHHIYRLQCNADGTLNEKYVYGQ